jgi:hypothetical protein
LRIKRKLNTTKLSAVAKSFNPKFVKVISKSDEEFRIQVTQFPFGLENISRELCETIMTIDRQYFYTTSKGKTCLQILKTVASGDPLCDTIYKIKKNKN